MDISARAISLADRPPTGPFGSPVFARAGKTDPPSRLILSQTSAGKGCCYVIDSSSFRTVPLFVPDGCSFVPACTRRPGRDRISLDALEGAPLVENRPGDAGELVGKRNRQHVVVQSFLGGLNPRFEAIAVPLL